METIPILINKEDEDKSGTLGLTSPKTVIKDVDASKLKKSLSSLTENISTVLDDIKAVGDFKLKEVTISVEINAQGGVTLIANASAGVKGAIGLTFAV